MDFWSSIHRQQTLTTQSVVSFGSLTVYMTLFFFVIKFDTMQKLEYPTQRFKLGKNVSNL